MGAENLEKKEYCYIVTSCTHLGILSISETQSMLVVYRQLKDRTMSYYLFFSLIQAVHE